MIEDILIFSVLIVIILTYISLNAIPTVVTGSKEIKDEYVDKEIKDDSVDKDIKDDSVDKEIKDESSDMLGHITCTNKTGLPVILISDDAYDLETFKSLEKEYSASQIFEVIRHADKTIEEVVAGILKTSECFSEKDIIIVYNGQHKTTPAAHAFNTKFCKVDPVGGLGNQLFEIATAYAYSKTNKLELVLDKSVKSLGGGTTTIRGTYYDNILGWVNDIGEMDIEWTNIKEKHFQFAEIPYIEGTNANLIGYYQSPKYFNEVRDEFKSLLFKSLEKTSLPFIPENDVETVSIHFRRGDYVGNSFHTSQTSEYYREALQHIKKETDKPIHIFIFSNGMDWCKENIPSIFRGETITYIEGYEDYEEIKLMSLIDRHIIVNSSFSWWGAYLSNDKRVIAPKKWFNDSTIDTSDIYVDGWVVI